MQIFLMILFAAQVIKSSDENDWVWWRDHSFWNKKDQNQAVQSPDENNWHPCRDRAFFNDIFADQEKVNTPIIVQIQQVNAEHENINATELFQAKVKQQSVLFNPKLALCLRPAKSVRGKKAKNKQSQQLSSTSTAQSVVKVQANQSIKAQEVSMLDALEQEAVLQEKQNKKDQQNNKKLALIVQQRAQKLIEELYLEQACKQKDEEIRKLVAEKKRKVELELCQVRQIYNQAIMDVLQEKKVLEEQAVIIKQGHQAYFQVSAEIEARNILSHGFYMDQCFWPKISQNINEMVQASSMENSCKIADKGLQEKLKMILDDKINRIPTNFSNFIFKYPDKTVAQVKQNLKGACAAQKELAGSLIRGGKNSQLVVSNLSIMLSMLAVIEPEQKK